MQMNGATRSVLPFGTVGWLPAQPVAPRICVASMYSPAFLSHQAWASLALERNLNWALAQGYSYFVFTRPLVPSRWSFEWNAPRSALTLLEIQGEENCAFLLWLDVDAIINKPTHKIESLISRFMGGSKPPLMLSSCHLPVVGDDGASCGSCRCLRASERCTTDMWADHASDSPNPHFCNINSGAFLLKNSAETRRVMRIWAFAGDGKCAVYSANSDQKCLMQLKQLFPKHIDVLSAKWFNAPSWFERTLNATGFHIKQQHLKSRNASAEDRFSCFGSHLFVCHTWGVPASMRTAWFGKTLNSTHTFGDLVPLHELVAQRGRKYISFDALGLPKNDSATLNLSASFDRFDSEHRSYSTCHSKSIPMASLPPAAVKSGLAQGESLLDIIACAGNLFLISRVQPDLRSTTHWATSVRTLVNLRRAIDPSILLPPEVNMSSNAAFMCYDDSIHAFGGPFQTFPSTAGRGIYRIFHASAWVVKGNAPPGIGQTESVNFMWNAPRRVLPESSNDCERSRRCEFGGKLSALAFRGRVRLFSRSTRSSNSDANVGLIHVASSAEIVNFGQKNIIQAVSKWSEWQKVQVQGVGTAKSGLSAELFVVQPWFNNSLLALYPAVFDGSGGIYYSISIDAVKWSAPVRLLQTGIYGNRTRAQPIRIIRKYLYVLQNVELSVPADVPPDYDPFFNEGRPCSDSSPPYLQRFNLTTALSETGQAQLQLADGEGEIVSVEPVVMQ